MYNIKSIAKNKLNISNILKAMIIVFIWMLKYFNRFHVKVAKLMNLLLRRNILTSSSCVDKDNILQSTLWTEESYNRISQMMPPSFDEKGFTWIQLFTNWNTLSIKVQWQYLASSVIKHTNKQTKLFFFKRREMFLAGSSNRK